MCKLSHFGLCFICFDIKPLEDNLNFTWVLCHTELLVENNGTIVQNKCYGKEISSPWENIPQKDRFYNVCVHMTKNEN